MCQEHFVHPEFRVDFLNKKTTISYLFNEVEFQIQKNTISTIFNYSYFQNWVLVYSPILLGKQ